MYKAITLHEISVRTDHGWAKLQWNEETGQVSVLSDHGHWSYYWNSIGNQTLAKFLSGLDYDYMGKKLLGNSMYVFSLDDTVKKIKQRIIERRKNGAFTADHARHEWRRLQQLVDGEFDFREWANTITDIYDPLECYCTEINPTWMRFWERLWVPCILPELKEVVKAIKSSK